MEPERTWAGTTLDARRAERRRRLLDAGYALLGEHGATAVTVRGVARAARLSERYFYESFADRDALLVAVHDRTADEARRVFEAALGGLAPDAGLEPLAHAALTALTAFVEGDPRRARILLFEPFADATLARHEVEVLPEYAALLVEHITVNEPATDATDARLTARALTGAIMNLFRGWLDGSLDVDRERLIRHAARLVAGAGATSSADKG